MLHDFVFSKKEEEKDGRMGTNGHQQTSALTLKLIKRGSGREVLENEQIHQIFAMNGGFL